jgi:hypothetical protein
MVLMSSAREANVDFRDIKLQFRSDEEVDPEIHFIRNLSREELQIV